MNKMNINFWVNYSPPFVSMVSLCYLSVLFKLDYLLLIFLNLLS